MTLPNDSAIIFDFFYCLGGFMPIYRHGSNDTKLITKIMFAT